MCDPGRLNHPGAFQLNWRNAQVVEQSDTVTEQDGHQVDLYFVKQLGLEALLHDIRARYGDILVPCGFLCLTNGTFNAICDEGEGRSFLDPFLWDGMGNDKIWSTPRRFAAPSAGDIEGPPSCHRRPYRRPGYPKKLGAGT